MPRLVGDNVDSIVGDGILGNHNFFVEAIGWMESVQSAAKVLNRCKLGQIFKRQDGINLTVNII